MIHPLIPKAIQNVLNEHQIAVIDQFLTEEPDALETLVRAANRLKDTALKEFLIETIIIPFNKKRLYLQMQDRIAQGHWTVQGVGGDASSPSFAYTVGLSVHCGVEAFCSGLDLQTMGGLLNTLAEILKVNPQAGVEDLPEPLITLVDGQVGRIRLERISLAQACHTHTYAVRGVRDNIHEEEQLVVLVFPDENNRLPGEEGYNQAFKQILPVNGQLQDCDVPMV